VDPLLVVFGFGVGVLVGLTGIGGGSLMTPLLILLFGVKPVTAIGTDLAYAAVTKTVGGYKHWRQRTVDPVVCAWMAVGSVPAAVGGVYVLHLLEESLGAGFDTTLIAALGVTLIVTGIATLVRSLFARRLALHERDSADMTARKRLAAVAFGAVVGFVLGVTSAGSGALIAVGLILIFRLTPTRVVGTDVVHAAILLWAAALAHLGAGNIDFALAGTILLGSVPGVWIGSHLSVRVPAAALRLTLAIVLCGAGLGLLAKSGLAVPTQLIAAIPLVAAGVVGTALVRAQRSGRAARPGAAPPRDAPRSLQA